MLLAQERDLAAKARQLVIRVILPGEWYLVRWGGTRKGAGTFYTRPGLAVPTVQRTLRPLAYTPPLGPDGRPDLGAPAARWTPKTPAEILDLKVCDSACGSGSFPVAALRFLTDALFASLHHHGRIREDGGCAIVPGEFLPCRPSDDTFEPRLKAILRRHVVERCIYGVDLDPLAVELCRLSLWIETMDRTLPFSFLDHKVKCGNSLVGAWFDQFQHYPVMTWKNREGGDKGHDHGVHFRKEERTKAIKVFVEDVLKPDLRGFLAGKTLFLEDLQETATAVHSEALATLARLHDLPVHDAAERARIYREELLGSPAYRSLKTALDLWCACWFWPADELADAPLPTTMGAPSEETRAIAGRIAAKMRFFHWELEFPDVFRAPGSGFDAQRGNPPWDIAKPSSMEFFSNLDPLYRSYGKQEALRYQANYFQAEETEAAWLDYNADFRAQSNFLGYCANAFGDPAENETPQDRFSVWRGRENEAIHSLWRAARARSRGFADPAHPFRHQGSADVNLYKTFLELAHALLRPGGRLGLIVPSGLYTDKGSMALRRLFLERCRWTHLYAFQNERFVFGAVHHSYKVISLCVEKGGGTEVVLTRFRLGPGDSPDVSELETDLPADDRYLPVRADQIARLSPRSLALLEIRYSRDLEVLEKIYAGSVLLGDDSADGWGIKYAREFDMTTDSHLFAPRPKWQAQGFRPDEYGRWIGPEGDVALPLYEGRMVDSFDPAQKAWVSGSARKAVWTPIEWTEKRPAAQFLMSSTSFLQSLQESGLASNGLKVAFIDVTAATNERTMVAASLTELPCGNTVPVLHSRGNPFALTAVLNSFAFDLVMRNRCGGVHLNYFVIEDAPLPPPGAVPLAASHLALRLGSSAEFMAPAWSALWRRRTRPWRTLWAITPHERLRLRSLLDAIVSGLYGLAWDDVAWILRDCDHPSGHFRDMAFRRTLDPKGFWRVDKEKDPELRHTVLTLVAFHDLEGKIRSCGGDREAGLEAFLAQNDGEGWMLPETLRLADYGLGHDDRAKEPQPVASRLGPRFYDWQLAQTAEESWRECHLHARNLLGEAGYLQLLAEIEAEKDGTESAPPAPPASPAAPGSPAFPNRSAKTPAQKGLFE